MAPQEHLISILENDIKCLVKGQEIMAAVVIRNIPEATHRALKERAKAHGRSTEAEIREILKETLMPARPVLKIGEALHAFGQEFGGIELEIPPRTELARAAKFE